MCSLIRDICDGTFLSSITQTNNGNYHPELFDLFNNKIKIIFLLEQTLRFAESYYVQKDKYS